MYAVCEWFKHGLCNKALFLPWLYAILLTWSDYGALICCYKDDLGSYILLENKHGLYICIRARMNACRTEIVNNAKIDREYNYGRILNEYQLRSQVAMAFGYDFNQIVVYSMYHHTHYNPPLSDSVEL